MKGKKVILKKKDTKKLVEFIIIISVVSVPFVSITNMVGMETFLDSFERPDSYIYLKNVNEYIITNLKKSSYIIIQKTDNPETEIKETDTVVYSKITGELACNKINQINSIGPIKRYEIKSSFFKEDSETIYEDQIIGKVVKIVDDNIWNALLMKIWSITTFNLNINSILE